MHAIAGATAAMPEAGPSCGDEEHTNVKPKNTICLWFDKDAHEAARSTPPPFQTVK